MSTRNWTQGGIGLAVAVLAAMTVTACDPYEKANDSAPQVIGASVIDINFNDYSPGIFAPDCIPPYPEPDQAWADTVFPGLCYPGGYPTVCPVECYPPRTGPAYAPFYQGNLGGSYKTALGGTYTYELPALGRYTVRNAPPGALPENPDFVFAQIVVLFNKTMDPTSIQGVGATMNDCPAAPGIKVWVNSPASAVGLGTDATADFAVCYVPNSPVIYWGAQLTATPSAGELAPDTKYTIVGTAKDQQGQEVSINVEVLTTEAPAPAPALRAR